MRADKAGRTYNSSDSLRTSQPSTTKLSNSDKLMGSLTYMPDIPQGGEYVEFELPKDGVGNSLSVRPASGQAKQVIGDLSRFSKKLHGSHESQTTKRTQSEADIGDEDDDNCKISKRQRTEDTAAPRARELGNSNAMPISLVQQIVRQPVVQPCPPTGPQPIVQTIAQTLDQLAQPALVITPDTQAQIDMAEALRIARSISPFQPEQITELFQFLCRSQLWQLLKLEEQRALYLMNLRSVVPGPYATASFASAGAAVDLNIPSSSSSSTTTTTMQPVAHTVIPLAAAAPTLINAVAQGTPLPNPESVTPTSVPIIQNKPIASGGSASKVNENLLPGPPNPPSLDHAKNLLAMLPEKAQQAMKMPPEKIRKMFISRKLELEAVNNLTAFTSYLVEVVSHGGLPHLDGELDGIINALLERYLKGHRQLLSRNIAARTGDRTRICRDIDPVYAFTLSLLPKYPQFTRVLGYGINNLTETKRAHLGLSRKFNAVLELMRQHHLLSEAEFNGRLDDIIDAAASSAPSSRTMTAIMTASTPTSATSKRREDDSDEGSDDAI